MTCRSRRNAFDRNRTYEPKVKTKLIPILNFYETISILGETKSIPFIIATHFHRTFKTLLVEIFKLNLHRKPSAC